MKNLKIIMTAMVILALTLTSAAYAYDVQYEFKDGIAVVKNDGKFGYVTQDGTQLVPCEYDYAFDFADGMANVVKNNKCGYINTTGTLVIPCEYEGATDFSEGAAAVQKDGKWAYVNKQGTLLTQFIYDGAGFFNDGFARVQLGDSFGYINLLGVEVVPCMYDEANAYIALYNAPKNQPTYTGDVFPITSKVTVDGNEKALDAYEINHYNYVKLRSLADALAGSSAPVNVDWDAEKECIILTSQEPIAEAEEVSPASIGIIGGADGPTAIFVAEPATNDFFMPLVYTSTCDVIYNGKPVTLKGYEINGNNYFKLRDMTELFGIGINWNEAMQVVEITTK